MGIFRRLAALALDARRQRRRAPRAGAPAPSPAGSGSQALLDRYHRARGPFVVATDSTRMPMLFTDAATGDNRIIFANDSMLRLTGYGRDELIGQRFDVLTAQPFDLEQGARDHFDAETHNGADALFRRKAQSDFWAAVFATPVPDAEGVIVQHFVSLVDLTRYKQAEASLSLSEGRFRLAATAAGLGVADIDLATGQVQWSDELRDILGVDDGAPAGPELYAALVHPDDRETWERLRRRQRAGETEADRLQTYRIVRPRDGAVRWIARQSYVSRDSDGTVSRMVVTNRDVTVEKTAHDRIAWAATHDGVTGLANRRLFRSHLEIEIEKAHMAGGQLCLLLLDLDHFKHINDLLGHQCGDEALQAFAARVAQSLPGNVQLARIGGDEFAVTLPGTLEDGRGRATAILALLQDPIWIGDRTIDMRASIGIGVYPVDGRQVSTLIDSADVALLAAKREGGARVRVFAPALRDERRRQRAMLRHARSALRNAWIEPFYQPKIELATGATVGYEALLRWRHPRAGIQLPGTIEYAFEDGYIACLLGVAMTDAVVADVCRWRRNGYAVGRMAMNASPSELRDAAYAERLLGALAKAGIGAERFELEVTETALLEYRGSTVVATLETLRAAGMTVALDDFGTGFSSLSHLRDFPVDTIKIDRSFVAGIDQSSRDRSIVRAVLLLGQALGLTTVAEGVETESQASFLSDAGCTHAQGFLFGRPLEAAHIEAAMAGA